MVGTKHHTIESVKEILSTVMDPEIPVLSVMEMGIVRNIEIDGDAVTVTITPTYSGCPAMHAIEKNIRNTLRHHGFSFVIVKTTFSPAWTTDWMSEATKRKLKEYGIAPPASQFELLQREIPVPCPYCHSTDTQMKSTFGSTACKSYYVCNTCCQPFEHFKPL
jgi:ring-1,2-phenylacetyl-CoA epoxidase subunit PaaD